MGKTYSRTIVVKQPAVCQVLMYSLSDILVEEVVVEFVLKGVYCVPVHYRRWELIPFPYHVISEEKFVQSSWNCLHLSFIPLFLVRNVLSIENNLLASTFVNPLRILKHSIVFPRSRRFSRENRFSRASLSSYDLLRKDVIIFVARRWTASSFAISFSW